jgi:hypothetical protein
MSYVPEPLVSAVSGRKTGKISSAKTGKFKSALTPDDESGRAGGRLLRVRGQDACRNQYQGQAAARSRERTLHL